MSTSMLGIATLSGFFARRSRYSRGYGEDGVRVNYVTRLGHIEGLSADERAGLQSVAEHFPFRANTYYLSLIDWSDPDDPIRRIIIPDESELVEWGALDASQEHRYTKVPGLEHKYESTAILLVSNRCGGCCRFCFRKRLFIGENSEASHEISRGLDYIRSHAAINNVLLTGGDPLILSTPRLGRIFEQIRDIPHVRIIRIGSKMPAFNPHRILRDPELLRLLRRAGRNGKKIYLMAHFNHPREMTRESMAAIERLQDAGVILAAQTPLLRGVNSDPEVLGELFNKLSYIGVPPYYVFQCRPTIGNHGFAIPIEEGLDIFERARLHGSGLAKRARFVMSHATGKIEIMGKTSRNIYMRYHRAADPDLKGRFMVYKRNPKAYWFDDYTHPTGVASWPSAIKSFVLRCRSWN